MTGVTKRLTLRMSLIVAAALLASGCTRPGSATPTTTGGDAGDVAVSSVTPSASTEPPSDEPPADEPPPASNASAPPTPTSSAPPFSPPPTSAPATPPPTTAPPAPAAPDDLVLAFDGVLPFRFGDHDIDVMAGLEPVLGPPVSDAVVEYPIASEGFFLDENQEISYISPVGRSACFANDLCLEFGSGSGDTLIFTAWSMFRAADPTLATGTGLAVGSPLADHVDAVAIDEGGCFSIGYGTSEGIDVTLQSDGEPFASVSDTGEFVQGDPDPAQVTIVGLEAGEAPTFLFADC